MVRLVTKKNNQVCSQDFQTIPQAFKFYLTTTYASAKEWQYIIKYDLLNTCDEDLIRAFFKPCFNNTRIIEDIEKHDYLD